MIPKMMLRILAAWLAMVSSAVAEDGAWPRIAVRLGGAEAQSGRVLLFAQSVVPGQDAPTSVLADPFFNKGNFVMAREIRGAPGGSSITLDGDDAAYPAPLSALPAGDYWVQAVLDRDHDQAYVGRADGGDAVSQVARMSLPSGALTAPLALTTEIPDLPLWETSRGPMFTPQNRAIIDDRIKPIAFVSPALTAFHGRDVVMKGLVLLPDAYHQGEETYPVVYFTHGFGGGLRSMSDTALDVFRAMHQGTMPPMIWVFLDQSTAFGTHEFADSVNNGPWATALTAELIPYLEGRYRTDGVASSRFLMGHSSGGWAMLWLQVNYPRMFGGAWISAPDLTSLRRYEGVDLDDPAARIVSEMGRMEAVLGEYGGQASSFEAVFSPRGADGRPMPLYDRATGAIDRHVADHWRTHWDVNALIVERWPTIGEALDGKLHVWVGEDDQFGLDQSVRDLEQTLAALGGRGQFAYLPGKGHFDLYQVGDDRQALRREMAWQMWRRARPATVQGEPARPEASGD